MRYKVGTPLFCRNTNDRGRIIRIEDGEYICEWDNPSWMEIHHFSSLVGTTAEDERSIRRYITPVTLLIEKAGK